MAATVAWTFEEQAGAQGALERRRAAGGPAGEISLIVRHRAPAGGRGDGGGPEEDAGTCTHCVGNGHALLVVNTEAAPPERVREIMLQAGAVNLYPAAAPAA